MAFIGPRAEAHAILLESRPAANATVDAGSVDLSLRFNCRIDAGRSQLVLQGPGREAETKLTMSRPATEDTLAAQVRLEPGEYKLRWQVLAVDGHITRGDVPFTVRR